MSNCRFGFHFDHFDLDSESGQSSNEPELDDNNPDEFVEQNNVDKIIQSLINNELPIHHHTQVQKLRPVEEDLMIVMKKHNLPIHLYKDLLALVERATASGYDFLSSPIYQTTLDHMKKKYFLEAGSPPVQGTVTVDGPFPPMHVYQFILLHHVKQQLQNPDNLKGAMWKYAEKCDPITNQHIFGSLNSSDWWKNADAALMEDLNKLGNNKPKGSHYVCPIIGFDDSTLCDNISRLMAQPFLATVGNLSDESHTEMMVATFQVCN